MTKPDWNIGYTTREHLCLDLDNTYYVKALNLVQLIMQYYPDVGDCLIMQSSTPRNETNINYTPEKGLRVVTQKYNYHVIFDNFIGYERCCHIIETLAELDIIHKEFVRIRQMRNDMTLRVSETQLTTGTKPAPKPFAYIRNMLCEQRGSGIDRYYALFEASFFSPIL